VTYSPLKVNRYFGRTCSLHLQGLRISQTINQHEAGNKRCVVQLSTWRYLPEVKTLQILMRVIRNLPQPIVSYTTISFNRIIESVSCNPLYFLEFNLLGRRIRISVLSVAEVENSDEIDHK
jgi:hypothetical protein